MARTEYTDPEAEDAYQEIAANSSKASISDAAAGLAQAKEDKKYSNTRSGNQMLNVMSARSALGAAYRAQRTNDE